MDLRMGAAILMIVTVSAITADDDIEDKANKETNIDSINGILQKHPVVSGKFVQSRSIVGFDKPVISSGDFIFLRSLGIYWHTLDPLEFSTAFHSEETASLHHRSSQKTGAMHKKIGELMMSFLGGDIRRLEKQFRLNLEESDDHWKLSLVPKSSMVKRQLSLLTLQGSDSISEINIVSEKSGTTTIRFNNVLQGEKLNSQQCTLISTYLGQTTECTSEGQTLNFSKANDKPSTR